MSSNNGRSRRVQGILAGVAGAALLLGGGTYALWTAQGNVNGGKITAGDLNLVAGTFSAYDVSTDRADAKTEIIADSGFMGHAVDLTAGDETEWNIVPGDTVALVFPFTATVKGDNLVTQLTTNTRALLASKDFTNVAGQLEFKYRLFGDTEEFTNGATELPASDTTPIVKIASNDSDKGAGVADTGTGIISADENNKVEVTYVLLVTFKSDAVARNNVNEVADLSGALTAKLEQIRTSGVGQFK